MNFRDFIIYQKPYIICCGYELRQKPCAFPNVLTAHTHLSHTHMQMWLSNIICHPKDWIHDYGCAVHVYAVHSVSYTRIALGTRCKTALRSSAVRRPHAEKIIWLVSAKRARIYTHTHELCRRRLLTFVKDRHMQNVLSLFAAFHHLWGRAIMVGWLLL